MVEKDEEPGSLAWIGAALFAFSLLVTLKVPGPQPARWGFAGGLACAVLVGLIAGWRRDGLLAAAFWTGGVGAAALATRWIPIEEGTGGIFVISWTIFVTAPFWAAIRAVHRLPGRPHEAGAAEPVRGALALENDEDRIIRRLREIEERRRQVRESLSLLDAERQAPALAPVREKLADAEGALRRQRARHVARLWTIEVLQWQHRLEGVLRELDLSWTSVKPRLARLSTEVGAGEKLLRGLEADADAASSFEGERCITQLRAILERCQEVRHALVVQGALQAIQGITPTDDEYRTTAPSGLPPEGLRAALDSAHTLRGALAAFEAEHARLKEDDEEAQDVERFLRELEREP
ncbi:MAG TPA: hypothetical protein VGB92_18110 [Longimicrobium sp.]